MIDHIMHHETGHKIYLTELKLYKGCSLITIKFNQKAIKNKIFREKNKYLKFKQQTSKQSMNQRRTNRGNKAVCQTE